MTYIHPSISLTPTKTMGLGYFTNTALEAGTILLVEQPFLSYPKASPSTQVPQLAEFLASLDPSGFAASTIASLSPGKYGDQCGLIHRVISNSFWSKGFCVLYEHASRFNHACIPNVITLDMTATKVMCTSVPVSAGEQLFIAYRQPVNFTMRTWADTCLCSADHQLVRTLTDRAKFLDGRIDQLRLLPATNKTIKEYEAVCAELQDVFNKMQQVDLRFACGPPSYVCTRVGSRLKRFFSPLQTDVMAVVWVDFIVFLLDHQRTRTARRIFESRLARPTARVDLHVFIACMVPTDEPEYSTLMRFFKSVGVDVPRFL